MSVFWPAFSHIRTEYGDIFYKPPYSVRMRENTENSEYGHFTQCDMFQNLQASLTKSFQKISYCDILGISLGIF